MQTYSILIINFLQNFTQNKSGQQEQKTKLEPEQNSPDKLPEDLKNKQFRNKNNKTNK